MSLYYVMALLIIIDFTMKNSIKPTIINSVSELHRMIGLPKPHHPLISLINLDTVPNTDGSTTHHLILNFYSVSLKKNVKGKLKYGQHYYDFDEGVLAAMSPGQLLSTKGQENYEVSGWWLVFHPDFIRPYHLGKIIREYGFFSYEVNEALHLSDKEEKMLEMILQNIESESQNSIDQFSQDVMVSYLDLLLNYTNRFYNRQFLTRKNASNDLLSKFEILLNEYFDNKIIELGLPTVQYVSQELNVSSHYLSDLLRSLTGQSTQQHIHEKLIEKAKEKLSSTSLSVGEIAFQLGYEHSQSFSKLFKSKVEMSPLEFRAKFNN